MLPVKKPSAVVKPVKAAVTDRSKLNLPMMITINEGTFLMGTSDEEIEQFLLRENWAIEWYEQDLFMVEQPQTEVTLPTFEMGKFPVTNVEYHAFVWETAYRTPRSWGGFKYPEGMGDHPVTTINKKDAEAYIAWLNKKSGMGFRLPTEAEWEYAARGVDGRIYPWGNVFDPWRCNTLESGKHSTSPVGSYSPSGDSQFSITDMVGNVWEWTNTLLKPYPYDPDDGREYGIGPGKFVVRGGAWYYSHKLSRCSSREGELATNLSPSLGFRLARTPEESEEEK